MKIKGLLISAFIIILSFYSKAQEFNELMEKGIESLRNFELDAARDFFTRAIELDSTSASAYLCRGESTWYSDKKQSEQDWLKSISLDSTIEGSYLQLHRYYQSESDYVKARYYLEKALSFSPYDSNNLLLMAQQLRAEQKLEEALEYCNKSIAAYNNQGEFLAHVERAEIKYELQDYQGAIDDFETCFFNLTFGMYTAAQFEMCGDAHAKLGQYEKACEKWNFAISHPDIDEPSKTARKKISKYCKKK